MAAKNPKIEVVGVTTQYEDRGPVTHWHVRLKAVNGKIVFPSETFPTRAHAVRALRRTIELMRDPNLEVDEG